VDPRPSPSVWTINIGDILESGGAAESTVGREHTSSTFDPWTINPEDIRDTIEERIEQGQQRADNGGSLDGGIFCVFILCQACYLG
jgi:hypothetical protein